MMNTMMNDEMLIKVTGGDYGDTEAECKSGAPLYKVGDYVEAYVTGFHWHTERGKIIEVMKAKVYTSYGFEYRYKIQFHNWTTDVVTADGIEK